MNLVTGATGLVGSHVLLTLLKQGLPVIAMKRSTSDVSEVEKIFSYYTPDYKEFYKKIIWREADLTDVLGFDGLLKDVTTVYHCAALISINNKSREQVMRSNVEGTSNLVNACILNKIQNFCFVSSIAALQNKEIKKDVDESVFWKSSPHQDVYSLSKYLSEQEVWRAREEGLNTIIVNPGVIIGPGNWGRGTGLLVSLSAKGLKFYTEGVTGFIGAEDVANVMVALINKKAFGERFVLIENNYSFKYIIQKIHSELGQPIPEINAGKAFLTLGRIFSFLLPAGQKISRSTISTLLSKNTYSAQKLRSYLDYTPKSIDECIVFTSKCYKTGKI